MPPILATAFRGKHRKMSPNPKLSKSRAGQELRFKVPLVARSTSGEMVETKKKWKIGERREGRLGRGEGEREGGRGRRGEKGEGGEREGRGERRGRGRGAGVRVPPSCFFFSFFVEGGRGSGEGAQARRMEKGTEEGGEKQEYVEKRGKENRKGIAAQSSTLVGLVSSNS